MVSGKRVYVLIAAAALLAVALAVVVWKLASAAEEPPRPGPSASEEDDARVSREARAAGPTVMLSPRSSQDPALPAVGEGAGTRKFEFTFEGETASELLKQFEAVPGYNGGFTVATHDPFDLGMATLYAFDPAQEDLVVDAYVKGFHEKLVLRAADHRLEPKLEDWPRFSAWLEEGVRLYAALHRKETGAFNALRGPQPSQSSSLSREERDALEIAENRLRELRLGLGRSIDRATAEFLGKPKGAK
jgi:hypothetical protein